MAKKGGLRDPQLLVGLGLAHCILQGVLIPLLVAFFSSSRKDKKRLKAYVVYVNVLALTQTVVHIVNGLVVFDEHPLPSSVQAAFSALVPILTAMLGASVQVFFIFRCWRIFSQRLLPIVPFLALWITALVPGIFLGVYFAQSLKFSTLKQAQVALAIWMFSSFGLELCVTITTVVYLLRTRTDLVEHNGVFNTIWQVTWVSAAPPPILMTIVLINGYLVNSLIHWLTQLAVDMTGKFYVLSLMITIVGREYIRARLDQNVARDSPPPGSLSRGRQDTSAVFAHNSNVYELEPRSGSATLDAVTSANAVSSTDCESGAPEDTISVRSKPNHPENDRRIHRVQLVRE